MTRIFVNPAFTNPGLETTNPIELRLGASESELEIVIRAVYRHVLGNAHIMESERLVVPESQLKLGAITVREFVRLVAKSELYRSRFFDNCYRFRAIELNFKHLLGRAPDDYSEMIEHSNILDEFGFYADIDSYLDSDEYINAYGENVVPFYRGYKTQPGQKALEFTNMLQLQYYHCSSDKTVVSSNKPLLQQALITNTPYGRSKPTDINALLAELFKSKRDAAKVDTYEQARQRAEQALQQKIQEQKSQIAALQQQLAELKPFAEIGAAQLKSSWQPASNAESEKEYTYLQHKADAQAAHITALQEEIADAQRFAAIGEARLNKWRSRVFSS